jgi:hypothetical protein
VTRTSSLEEITIFTCTSHRICGVMHSTHTDKYMQTSCASRASHGYGGKVPVLRATITNILRFASHGIRPRVTHTNHANILRSHVHMHAAALWVAMLPGAL